MGIVSGGRSWVLLLAPLLAAVSPPLASGLGPPVPTAAVEVEACGAGGGLCLGGRFTAAVTWSDPRRGAHGFGRPLRVTPDTGAFWFFDPANLELVVKVLDARRLDGRFWVFSSGLTDVAVELTLTDTVSGLARRYTNPPFTAPLIQDTDAFDSRLLEPELTDRRLLWIGAHPDDEVLAAPWLGEVCLRRGATCAFLVATRGEAGECALPGGCGDDLGRVRTEEMEAAATLYEARLTQWDLADGSAPTPAAVRQVWARAGGDEERLLADLEQEIAAFGPDWILTFDPRHGSTCHADHRALGSLVLAATARLPPGPEVWLLASRALFEEGLPSGFLPAATGPDGTAPPRLTVFDARGEVSWEVLVENARRHPSQFPAEVLQALERVEPSRRAVFFLHRRDAPSATAEGVCALP